MSDNATTNLPSIAVDKIGAGQLAEDVGTAGQVLISGGPTGEISWSSSPTITYDNSSSTLSATTVQDAIDELDSKILGQDEASEISYDNTTSGLSATDVQTAIDETEGRLDTAETSLSSHIGASSGVHGVTGDVVGTSDSQTLSNKTIGSTNSVARSAINSGSANNVIINDGSGNLSSEATLAKSRGGTGADNSSVTFPASGTITTEASNSTLTNKTIDADNNTISNLAHGSEVDNPTSGVHGVTGDIVGTTDSQTLSSKTLSSPVLNGSLSGDAFLDEDGLSSNSAVKLASQQSIKAYIDNNDIINYGEKVLSSNVTTTGDITSLTFTGLTASSTYEIELCADVDFGNGDASLVIEVYDGTSGGGTSIIRLGGEDEQGSGSAGDETQIYGLSKSRIRTMSTSTLTVNVSFMPTNGIIIGGGASNRTYITVKELKSALNSLS